MSYKVTFFMEPVAKGRPRFSIARRKRGDTGPPRIITRTPERTDRFENELRLRVCNWLGRRKLPLFPKGTPVALDFDFVFQRPLSQCRLKDPFGLLWKGGVPDVDNLQKSAMDALKGIFWYDDAQVVDIRARKLYGDKRKGRGGVIGNDEIRPRIGIFVREAKEIPIQVLCSEQGPDRIDLELGLEYSPKSKPSYFKKEGEGRLSKVREEWFSYEQQESIEQLDLHEDLSYDQIVEPELPESGLDLAGKEVRSDITSKTEKKDSFVVPGSDYPPMVKPEDVEDLF